MTEPTDAEILELASQYWHCLDETESATEIELVRAALAKWGTPPAVAGEPVAWLDPWTGAKATTDYDAYGKHGIPLYTVPQLAPAPSAAADLIAALASAPKPSSTPQADSQPALPEITAEDRSFLHYNPNTDDIVEWVHNYASAAIAADRAMRAQAAPAAAAGPVDELAELSLLNRLIDLGSKAAGAHAASNSDDGHKGTAAYVQWQELRSQMGDLIRAAYAAPTTQAQAGALESAEFGRFLSDVLTAAGLVTHGKQCKALGERLADMCAKLRRHGIKGGQHGIE